MNNLSILLSQLYGGFETVQIETVEPQECKNTTIGIYEVIRSHSQQCISNLKPSSKVKSCFQS